MNTNDLNTEARKQKRLAKLGSDHPVCVICSENDWRCLELHHLSGQAFGDDLCIVCRNCHRKLSDEQENHPKQIGKPPSKPEAIGHMLLGLADLFVLLVDIFREFGLFLIKSAQPKAGA